MEQISTVSLFMLFLRVQLFLFGVIFSAIGAIVKRQFKAHGKIAGIAARCQLHDIIANQEKK